MGRDRRNENRSETWAKMISTFMKEPAWAAMSTSAQALYPWLKMECGAGVYARNGHFEFSVRQAAEALGVVNNTAAKALHVLQAKGFLVVTKPAVLGVVGQARGNSYELTELPLKGSQCNTGRQLYKKWKPGHNFHVTTCKTNNPNGFNGKQNPISKTGTSRTNNEDVQEVDVPIIEMGRTNNEDEQTPNTPDHVPVFETSLSTIAIGNEPLALLSVQNGFGLCGKAHEQTA